VIDRKHIAKPAETDVKPTRDGEMSAAPRRFARIMKRLKTHTFRFLIVLYVVLVMAFGYWYLSRPVRASQLSGAYQWWMAIGKTYHAPEPKNEQWE
jgi:magnesium-transporting ATPase (P-type)